MTKGGLARLRPTDRKAPLKRYVRFVAHSSGARCVLCCTLPPENDPLIVRVQPAHAETKLGAGKPVGGKYVEDGVGAEAKCSGSYGAGPKAKP